MLDVALSVERGGLQVAATFSVGAGERLGLFGPSGAGKSTVLETIAGLVASGRGSICLAGRELAGLAPHERRVGLLRQDPALFPHLSVAGNLAYARLDHLPGAIEELAGRLGLAELLGQRPARLSGGQRQRVALGRLLLAEPAALLLDEPFEGLDPALRRELTGLVQAEVAARGLPVVLVSHELADLQSFADRIALLDAGRILQIAPVEEIVRLPASRRAAELLGYRAFLPAGVPGELLGVHPDRLVPGRVPELGPGPDRPGARPPPLRRRLAGGPRGRRDRGPRPARRAPRGPGGARPGAGGDPRRAAALSARRAPRAPRPPGPPAPPRAAARPGPGRPRRARRAPPGEVGPVSLPSTAPGPPVTADRPASPIPRVAGILLTGGASRRMGSDKATLVVAGAPSARRIASLLSRVAHPVLEVGPGCSGLASVREDPLGEGPLVAVAAGGRALRRLGHSGPALVLACDLPLVDESLLRFLARRPGPTSVVPEVEGRSQPLCARWSLADLTAAAALAAAGERALRAMAWDPGTDRPGEPEWSAVASARTFADADSPDDLDRLGLAFEPGTRP